MAVFNRADPACADSATLSRAAGAGLFWHQAHVCVACDCRLDNRAELGARLGAAATLGDAALIGMAYLLWGADCAAHLRGDFAFALWDSREQRMVLARDRLGCRELSFYADARVCVAASRVRDVLAHLAVPRAINERKVARYVAGVWDEPSETFFEDVFYLPPAHVLVVTRETMRQTRYWDVDPARRIRHKNDEGYADEFRHLIGQAVRARAAGAGRLGLMLSGGLDSSVIAAVAGQPGLDTFSYVFDRFAACDERAFITPLAQALNLQTHFVNADAAWPFSEFDTWPVFEDFPASDAFIRLPLLVIALAAQHGVGVLLNGQFGDVLLGSDDYWAADPLQEGRWAALRPHSLREIAPGARALVPARLKALRRAICPRRLAAHELNAGLADAFAKRAGVVEAALRKPPTPFTRSDLQARYWALLGAVESQGVGIVREMYHRFGVEPASPLRDVALVEFVMALPSDQIGGPGRTRRVLRNALRGLVPEAVRERRGKTSFMALFAEGLFHREKSHALALAKNAQVVARGWCRAGWMEEQLQAGAALPDGGYAVWMWLCVELWLRKREMV